ncbi:MAG TPA: divalent-cation tolerance protein CutA [Candidatus Paceibacterota bacterium]|nr:divalent-cation tolerance protein CutA [Candidatus Paceibacterota bacterium]HSA03352.1 divalent-cation tolerance protein CutA [Candidatus Paceibacterota bacterium]
MKTTTSVLLVLVTAPNMKTARRLVNEALKSRLVACANLVSTLESNYWWQGSIERSKEVLILFKTTKARMAALEKLILAVHPYDTPEIVAIRLSSGTPRYLDWVANSVRR